MIYKKFREAILAIAKKIIQMRDEIFYEMWDSIRFKFDEEKGED